MGFQLAHVDGVAIIDASGDLDMANRDELYQLIVDAAAATDGPVVLDMTALEFIDSSGLTALLSARRQLGDRFTLRAVPQRVRRVMSIAGVDTVLLIDEAGGHPAR